MFYHDQSLRLTRWDYRLTLTSYLPLEEANLGDISRPTQSFLVVATARCVMSLNRSTTMPARSRWWVTPRKLLSSDARVSNLTPWNRRARSKCSTYLQLLVLFFMLDMMT